MEEWVQCYSSKMWDFVSCLKIECDSNGGWLPVPSLWDWSILSIHHLYPLVSWDSAGWYSVSSTEIIPRTTWHAHHSLSHLRAILQVISANVHVFWTAGENWSTQGEHISSTMVRLRYEPGRPLPWWFLVAPSTIRGLQVRKVNAREEQQTYLGVLCIAIV